MKKNRKRKEKQELAMASSSSASEETFLLEEEKSCVVVVSKKPPTMVGDAVDNVEEEGGVGSSQELRRIRKRKLNAEVQGSGTQEQAATRICNANGAEKNGFGMVQGNCLVSREDMNDAVAAERTSGKFQNSRKKKKLKRSETEAVKGEEDGELVDLSVETAKARLVEDYRAAEKQFQDIVRKKKLKRSEREEAVKEEEEDEVEDGHVLQGGLSLEAAKARLLENRVWQYVCQRALIGDIKASIRNPHLVVKSFGVPNSIAAAARAADLRRNPDSNAAAADRTADLRKKPDPIAAAAQAADFKRNPLSELTSPGGIVSNFGASQALLTDKQLLSSSGIKPIAAVEFPNFNSTKTTGCVNKTTVTHVIANGNKIAVTVTKEGAVVRDWILRQKATLFGMDSEWRPSYVKGVEHKTALLQICRESECLMIQMLFIDAVPSALVNFLKDPKIQLAGVGIDGDIQKLRRDHGLECKGAIELTTLAAKKYERVDLKGAGLKALAKLVINFDMVKQKKVTMSNWANRCLDRIQLDYACLDAWVSYAIHEGLTEAPAQ